MLTLERCRELFEIDPSVPSGLRWKISRNRICIRQMAGARVESKSGRVHYHVRVGGKLYQTSVLVWSMCNGRWPDPGKVIDHIVGLDSNGSNDISNLRELTQQQNSRGHRIRPVKGYYWNKQKKKYHVRLTNPSTHKVEFYRYCNTEEEAIAEANKFKAELRRSYPWAYPD